MADTRKPPESPGGGPRRKRAAPTIDLKATDVSDPPADKPEAAASESQPDVPPAAVETPPEPAPETTPESTSEPAPEAAISEPSTEEPAQAEPEAAAPPPPPSRGGIGAGITGGVIGALIVAALGAGAWYTGYIPASSTQQSDLPARLAALEKQVGTMQNQPPPKLDTAALDKSVSSLGQRVGKLESALGNLPPTDRAAVERLGALSDQVKSLSDAVNALNKRADTIAATAGKAQQSAAAAQKTADALQQSVQNVASAQKSATPTVSADALDALQKKVAALETALTTARNALNNDIKTVRGDVSSAQKKIAEASAGESATRLALSATALRNAVLSGVPYAAQLAQAKSLGADAKSLAPLARFAQTGLPNRNALAGELIKLVPAMRKVAGTPTASGSFLERLQANAEKLVRVTPVETPAGNAPADILARIEAAAAHADIAAALSDLAKLPDNVRAPAQGWIAKAEARQAALAAARSIAANAARGLGKG